MYYLKYRPRLLEEIDNLQARETISNILLSKDLPHAFLFVGQKGTGKTSTARIFAKSINCLGRKGSSPNPCNKCPNCLSIDKSSSPDVFELDAASNRGINEIKNLIKESSFLPMTGKSRIFIIDEAHMITNDAFNALLKTLEEPPDTVIFVLATTNAEKIPVTIASRCVYVNFGKAKKTDIKNMLTRVISGEKLQISEKISDLIASHAQHSFRDAAKLLEELVMQNKLTESEASQYIGVRAKKNIWSIITTQPLKDALLWVEDFSQSGGSFKILIEDMIEDLHDFLLAKHGILKDNDVQIALSIHDISICMKLLHEAYTLLKVTPIDSVPLEIALIEFYNLRKIKN